MVDTLEKDTEKFARVLIPVPHVRQLAHLHLYLHHLVQKKFRDKSARLHPKWLEYASY